jgi:hypothetical protein
MRYIATISLSLCFAAPSPGAAPLPKAPERLGANTWRPTVKQIVGPAAAIDIRRVRVETDRKREVDIHLEAKDLTFGGYTRFDPKQKKWCLDLLIIVSFQRTIRDAAGTTKFCLEQWLHVVGERGNVRIVDEVDPTTELKTIVKVSDRKRYYKIGKSALLGTVAGKKITITISK